MASRDLVDDEADRTSLVCAGKTVRVCVNLDNFLQMICVYMA